MCVAPSSLSVKLPGAFPGDESDGKTGYRLCKRRSAWRIPGNGGSMTSHLPRLAATLALLALVSWPALADTQFRARRMTRGDVPLGKGQCDIRLRIDGEAEVSVRGDMVYLRTVNGRDGRDEGSECNEPLPDRLVEGFGFEVRDRRGDIVLLSEPSRRNGFRAVVRIRDNEGGEGRYHFRLSWQMDGGRDPFGSGPGPGYGSDPGDSRRRGGAAG